MASQERGGLADVIYVLCLMQASFLVLAGLGEVLMMGGNPLYLVLPILKGVLLIVLGTSVVRHRTWSLVTLIVVQALTLLILPLQIIVGVIPFVDFAPSLTQLVSGVAMPVLMIIMCGMLIARRPKAKPQPRPPVTYQLAVPQDPYSGAIR